MRSKVRVDFMARVRTKCKELCVKAVPCRTSLPSRGSYSDRLILIHTKLHINKLKLKKIKKTTLERKERHHYACAKHIAYVCVCVCLCVCVCARFVVRFVKSCTCEVVCCILSMLSHVRGLSVPNASGIDMRKDLI